MEMTKTCSCCKEIKPLSDYSKNKTTKDGFQNTCRSCANERSRKYYKQNPKKKTVNQPNLNELTEIYLKWSDGFDDFYYYIPKNLTEISIKEEAESHYRQNSELYFVFKDGERLKLADKVNGVLVGYDIRYKNKLEKVTQLKKVRVIYLNNDEEILTTKAFESKFDCVVNNCVGILGEETDLRMYKCVKEVQKL